MKTADVFPSKYLKAEEMDGDLSITIKHIELETLESKDGRKQEKPVLYFNELEKGLVLNKTNWAEIVKQHGDESDDWIGKVITLFVMDVEAFGEIVAAIRIRPQRKTAAKAAKQKPGSRPAIPAETNEDDISSFWIEVKKQGLERKEGLAILSKHDQDFAAALAELTSA